MKDYKVGDSCPIFYPDAVRPATVVRITPSGQLVLRLNGPHSPDGTHEELRVTPRGRIIGDSAYTRRFVARTPTARDRILENRRGADQRNRFLRVMRHGLSEMSDTHQIVTPEDAAQVTRKLRDLANRLDKLEKWA